MESTKQIFVFLIGMQHYGIGIEKVYRIAINSWVERISPQMIGIAGETFVLCDLHSILSTKSSADKNVFCVAFSANGKKAFSVDKIEGLFEISADGIKSCDSVSGCRSRLINEFALLDNNIIPLLDTDNL